MLSHPQHAFKYQMRSEISLNFSVNSERFNSSPPLPQALFSVDVGLISKSSLKRFNIRSLRKPSSTQNTLNCILLLPKKSRHFSISRMKPISTSILFSEHALPLPYLALCGLCNPNREQERRGCFGRKEVAMGLRALLIHKRWECLRHVTHRSDKSGLHSPSGKIKRRC